MIEITREPLDPEAITAKVRHDSNGAVVTFLGTTRDSTAGRRVLRLEYEAYRPMADNKLAQIVEEMKQRWASSSWSPYGRRRSSRAERSGSAASRARRPKRPDDASPTATSASMEEMRVAPSQSPPRGGEVGLFLNSEELLANKCLYISPVAC